MHASPASEGQFPINTLFESPIHNKEVMDEMHRLTPDKTPGPDGVKTALVHCRFK